MTDSELIFSTVENDDVDLMTNLIKNGADINCEGKNSITPLMYAIEKNKKNIVLLLIKNGVDLNYEAKSNYTALTYCISRSEFAASILLDESDDLENFKNKVDFLIQTFDKIKEETLDMVLLLIKNGADVNYEQSNGTTPIAIAKRSLYFNLLALYSIYDLVEENIIKEVSKSLISISNEIQNVLIKYGADENYINKFGKTPSEYAESSVLEDVDASIDRCTGEGKNEKN